MRRRHYLGEGNFASELVLEKSFPLWPFLEGWAQPPAELAVRIWSDSFYNSGSWLGASGLKMVNQIILSGIWSQDQFFPKKQEYVKMHCAGHIQCPVCRASGDPDTRLNKQCPRFTGLLSLFLQSLGSQLINSLLSSKSRFIQLVRLIMFDIKSSITLI